MVWTPPSSHEEGTMSASTYRAAVVRTPGGPDTIELVDVPVPTPGPGEVRVAVAAAPVHPVDLAVVAGVFHEMGVVLRRVCTGRGWDFAGTVVAAGPGVDLAAGQRVAGLVVGFDRDAGSHAEQIVVRAADVAPVPDDLDLVTAATVPLDGLAAAQVVDALGDPGDAGRLLVTGAAGSVGGFATALARDRGWRVTGLARDHDAAFLRGLAAEPTTQAEPGWDAVADAAGLREGALALVRDGGTYVGVLPAAVPAAERGVRVAVIDTVPDGERLADLLKRAAAGELPARVHAVVPLDEVADAHRAMAEGGRRGRVVLVPCRRTAAGPPASARPGGGAGACGPGRLGRHARGCRPPPRVGRGGDGGRGARGRRPAADRAGRAGPPGGAGPPRRWAPPP